MSVTAAALRTVAQKLERERNVGLLHYETKKKRNDKFDRWRSAIHQHQQENTQHNFRFVYSFDE